MRRRRGKISNTRERGKKAEQKYEDDEVAFDEAAFLPKTALE